MTLRELLERTKTFEGYLFGAFDIEATFIWEDMELTEYGYKAFKPIMDCEIKVNKSGNVEVLVGKDPDDKLSEMVNDFVMSVAGYCSCTNYDKWFKEL